MKLRTLLPALALSACVAPPAVVVPPVVVAPEARTLAQEIAATPALATFSAQAAAAGRTTRLAQPAPVTVFAADETAFAHLSPGVVAALVEPENRDLLVRFTGYHLVEGVLDRAELRRRVAAGGGRALLPTLSGVPLAVSITGDTLTLTDPDGDRAYLIQPEIVRPNGVLHVVNGVVAPD